MFFRLGFLNATRNLTRSLLAIISMAVAGAILTTTLTLSRGYPREAYRIYRQMLGGEVVAYSVNFTGDLTATDGKQAPMQYNRLVTTPPSDLAVFRPELFTEGFLARGQVAPRPFTEAELKAISSAPGVAGVYPYYVMPGQTLTPGGEGRLRYQSPIRGRDIHQTAGDLGQTVVAGRYFTTEDDGRLVAVVSSKQQLPKDVKVPAVGSRISVRLPKIVMQDGQPTFDYEHGITTELQVIGQVELPTRLLTWQTDQGTTAAEQLYWHTSEIQVPLATWQALYGQAGGTDYAPYQVALHIPDLTYLEDTVVNLSRTFSHHSFVSVPRQAELAARRGLIEPIFRAPAEMRQPQELAKQDGLPLDLRKPLLVLVYLNAALIVAANMLTAVNERKKEMGILKAVGARRLDIVTMAVTEAMLLSAIGATGGFLLIRIFGVITQITNGHSLGLILRSVGGDYLMVIGSTLVVSLLFGLLPALKLSRLTAMEVLRND